MRILVTGGAGFIGSHVVDALVGGGHEVAVVDDLSTGKRENVSGRARFHEADVAEADGIVADVRPEVVLHLAAQINVRSSIHNPLHDAQVNVLGTLSVLEACRWSGVRRMIFASTGGAIYGEQTVLPCAEDAQPRPASPYAIAKLACEHYARFFRKSHGLEIVNLRLANVYGPRQDPKGEAGVVAIFAEKMLRGETPTINGDGLQTRDYVYVGDVAEAFVRAIDGPAGTYNVGTGVETNVIEIYEKVKALIDFKGERLHGPAITGEVSRNALDAGRAAAALGWKARTGLGAGLAATVDSFR